MINVYSSKRLYTNNLTPLEVGVEVDDVNLSNDKILWNFGDGTLVKGLTASHVYLEEGEYDVTFSRLSSTGEPFNSESITVSAYNLIPNNIEWSDFDYTVDVLEASKRNYKPFVFNVINSHQYDSDIIEIDLYAHNSLSIPFSDEKDSHLKNTWSFYDINGNRTSTINLVPEKIYAKKDEANKIVFCGEEDSGSVLVGLSAFGGFYFSDDTPSTVVSSYSKINPVILAVTQNLSSFYSDFISESYVNNYTLNKGFFIIQNEPKKLTVTQDGYHDFVKLKYENTRIPFTIALADEFGNLIKTQPNFQSNTNEISAFFSENVEVSSFPLSGLKLKSYNPNNTIGAGYVNGEFIPLDQYSNDIRLHAAYTLEYTDSANFVINGWFTDVNGANLYKVKSVYPFSLKIDSEDVQEPVQELELPDELKSGVFGISVDRKYNSWVADAYNSKVYVYDTQFNIVKTLDVLTYSNLISSSSAPAQISIDPTHAYITLFDSGSAIKVSINTYQVEEVISLAYPYLTDIDWSILTTSAGEFLTDSDPYTYNEYNSVTGDLMVSPAAIEITNNGLLWISNAASTLSSEVMLMDSTDVNNRFLLFDYDDQIVEIRSNRNGNLVYLLGYNDERVTLYRSENTLSGASLDDKLVDLYLPQMSSFAGGEFMTLDNDQNVWIAFGSNGVLKYDTSLSSISTQFVGSSTFGQKEIGGISSDHLNRIWVLHRADRKLYLLNTDETDDGVLGIEIDPNDNIPLSSYVADIEVCPTPFLKTGINVSIGKSTELSVGIII